jgi:hypothetical protein
MRDGLKTLNFWNLFISGNLLFLVNARRYRCCIKLHHQISFVEEEGWRSFSNESKQLKIYILDSNSFIRFSIFSIMVNKLDCSPFIFALISFCIIKSPKILVSEYTLIHPS